MNELMASLPGAGALLDRGGLLQGFTPALPPLLGVSPKDLAGRPLAEALEPGARETLARHLRDTAAAGEALCHVVHGGSVLALHSRALAGGILCLLQPRLEREQLRLLERAGYMDLLVSAIAHEINNPLTFILTNAQLLEGGSGEEVQESIEDITDGVKRIGELTGLLQELSIPEEDAQEADLAPLLAGAMELVTSPLKYRARPHLEVGALPPVKAQPEQLLQALLTLLVNAVQAIPPGDIQGNSLTLRAWAEGDHARVEVEDTGVGISAEILPRIFEPFFSTWGRQGLGLAFCRQVVTEAGGSIEAEPGRARGARFILRLPLVGE